MSVIILAVSALGYGAYRYYDAKLSVIAIHLPGQPSVPASRGAAQNFLLVGSDTRNFAGGQQFQAAPGSPDFVTGQRSDTVILVHIPAGRAKATIVSFPRDSYVQIPAYTDSSGRAHPAHMGKLNEAFSDGGAPLLVNLIEGMTGLHVDHYVQVDFGGFENMVNALGGINLCIGTSRHDKDSGDYLTAGQHNGVNGAQALAFVRDRKGLPAGDIDRIKDQQYFLSQMLKKVLSAGTLSNPFTLNRFLTALTSNVTVDKGFGFNEIRTLATRLRHLDPTHVTFVTIPFSTDNGTRTFEGYTQSVVLLDPVADQALFARLRNDSQPQPHGSGSQAPPATALTVPPGQITVAVRNATSIPGLAARTAAQLRAVGFLISDVGTVAATPGTQIIYSPDRADSARTLAAAVPGSVLVSDPTGTNHVELVLGSGPVTVAPVTVAPAAPGAGAGTSAAAPLTAADATCAP